MMLASFVSALVVSVAGVVYTGISQEQNNRQWCELLSPLDNAYTNPSTPPATELGKKVAEAIHKLHRNFGC